MIRLQSYNNLVHVIVISVETLLCVVLFEWMDRMLSGTLWEKMQNLPKAQILFTLMLCYLVCAMRQTVLVYRRLVYAFQIVTSVCRNVLSYAILAGGVLGLGGCIDVWSYFFVGYLLVLWVCLMTFRLGFRFAIKHLRLQGKNRKLVVLVGHSDICLRLYYELTSEAWAGYDVAGYFGQEPNPDFPDECRFLGKPSDIIAYLQTHPGVEGLFCNLSSSERERVVELVSYCENHLVHFYSVPEVLSYIPNTMYLDRVGGVPYLSLYREPLSRLGNQVLKRGFDIVFSLVFLCTLFPVIWLVVAMGTKCTMPGPVFFRQKRTGINDKEFVCYKFRSMVVNDRSDLVQARRDDPRITPWGRFLRQTSLDETPQFFNVFRGDMSVVGPRPHMLKHTEQYSRLINRYMVRHYVKPGITGWSQVSGYRGETRKLEDMENRVRNDIWYIEHWSFMLDLYIIYKTVANLIRGEANAY